ncbi:hypothetical protein N7462_010587 [Penicillium macrosclerotiorum]|uniref:uncharacterized protein n=1 Tax=Penicillium macrosclerotiorum TaxID=303699 RepID=UPI0025472887|nr:uncharacterized protein N7462_010587 [Penicillium macrosclerotiorum]KAJ5669517.1 hypothetical protein N7462_010587 [Penicillium macrosclerotiorum]
MEIPNPQHWHKSDNKNEIVNEQEMGRETKFSISKQDILILLSMASLSLMAALDGTSISVALPTISHELGGTAIEAFWTGTSFTLCSAVFQPVFSSLSNLFGRKPLVLAAIAWFTIGTIVAGVANNFTHMLIGRSLQGIGGGGVITLTAIIIADIVPLSERAKYFGMLSAIWSLGTVVGPVIGGCFAEKISWRWIFYINFPFIGIGAILVSWSSHFWVGKETFATQMRKIDFVGIAIFIPSSASFLIPLTWGGVLYPWYSWHTLAPLIIGSVGLCIFAIYEWRVARHPMIPPAIFHDRTALISFAGYAVVGLLIWCCLYFLPLYYEAVKGFKPIMSGIALFPETFTVAPSGVIVGLLISRTGQYYWAVCTGWCLSTIGMGLLCLLEVNTGTITWVFLNLVPGIGIGMVLPSVALAVQASATAENLAIAVAASTSFRGFGQSIGVAIGGVIFQNQMKNNLWHSPALQSVADKYSGDAASMVEIIRGMHGQVKMDLQQAYADSLRIVWAFCCGISGLMFIVSLFTQSYDLNRTLITK